MLRVSCKYIPFYYGLGSALEENAKYWNKQSTMRPNNNAMKMGMKIKLIGFWAKNLEAYDRNTPVIFILLLNKHNMAKKMIPNIRRKAAMTYLQAPTLSHPRGGLSTIKSMPAAMRVMLPNKMAATAIYLGIH